MKTNPTQTTADQIQNYREHLELLCRHSKREYCVGCGMTDEFFDAIVAQAKREARREVLKDLLEKAEGNRHDYPYIFLLDYIDKHNVSLSTEGEK